MFQGTTLVRLIVALALLGAQRLDAGVHGAPIVIQAKQIRELAHFPVAMYRLFRTGPNGQAISIPFQIDEVNDNGDFVLDQGGDITRNTGNGVFDNLDELAFMGNDTGPATAPSSFTGKRPSLLYEIRVAYSDPAAKREDGAVFVGVFFTDPPTPSKDKYVVFQRDSGSVLTSRYRYRFDPKNWLVVSGVEMRPSTGNKEEFVPLLDSSTFYLNADLKYFLTLTANHRTVSSSLEAYKIGPVRSIIRISFFYSFLKINFELGMYTEVSFFSNAVFLPAIMYNPVDGKKTLNRGSGFYYGFAMRDNPGSLNVETNMPAYAEPKTLDMFKTAPKPQDLYWITASNANRMMHVEIRPSREMQEQGALPSLYVEKADGPALAPRGNADPQPLGKSPVNMALAFDLTKFKEGEHIMSFRLFFENTFDQQQLDQFRTLSQWEPRAQRVVDFLPSVR